jgi:hypothetical protein
MLMYVTEEHACCARSHISCMLSLPWLSRKQFDVCIEALQFQGLKDAPMMNRAALSYTLSVNLCLAYDSIL